tara:strand:- start:493 stop:729 length:237 start_codon:yes stop_codon:yes gene_type:complete
MPSAADSNNIRNLSKWFNSIKQNKDTKTIKKPNPTNVTKRQQATCPYCDGNLNLADGQWDSKYCTTCKKRVKPYGKPQ